MFLQYLCKIYEYGNVKFMNHLFVFKIRRWRVKKVKIEKTFKKHTEFDLKINTTGPYLIKNNHLTSSVNYHNYIHSLQIKQTINY